MQKNVTIAVALAAILVAAVYIRRKHMKDKFSPDEVNWPSSGIFGATGQTYPYGNYAGNGNARYPLLY